MRNAEFPSRTAGDLPLPSGESVWVCTLNTLLKEEADRKARRFAANECRALLKGGADYPALVAEIKSFDAQKQATYLAEEQFWTIRQEAQGKHPDPPEPEQGELDPEAFARALQAWEGECQAAAAKRVKLEETRHAAEVKKALALTEKVRVERCCAVYFGREWAEVFVKRLVLETLFRAVRQADDHSQRYFASAQAVEDADDPIFNALNAFYFETLDTVKPDEIPTSPAAS